jgi:hypothetical protein
VLGKDFTVYEETSTREPRLLKNGQGYGTKLDTTGRSYLGVNHTVETAHNSFYTIAECWPVGVHAR